MKRKNVLSVFVDESGRFKYPDSESHYYIVGLVFHDQDVDITPLVHKMDQKVDELGLDTDVFAFHAGPMTHSEFKFFGSPRKFQHNVLRKIKAKEI